MDNENNSYPDFVPNQILTNNQLNQLRKYLDHQERLGRVRLAGTGIICGLNVSVVNSNTKKLSIRIAISDGFGVSSEGYFLELENSPALTHWREYTDPNIQKNGTITYQKWRQKGHAKRHIKILELSTDVAGAKTITPQLLQDRVLVLYLEQKNEQLDSCLVTDCDSKGVNVRFTIRILLVTKQALQPVEFCESKKNQLIHIPRLYTVLPLTEVEESAQINQAYQNIVEQALEGVLNKIEEAYKKYATFLSLDEDRLQSLENLQILLEESSQYSWDILNDIADAYNEFITYACELLTPCLFQQDFPRHLMLGAFDGEAGYRNTFTPSRIRNVENNAIERARALFLRILVLADNVDVNRGERTVVTITPSHTKLYPLGKRALPFYYSTQVKAFWQPQMCCTMNKVWSYHFQQNLSDVYDLKQKLSEFDYENASFLRIEGHIGKQYNEVVNEIITLQHGLNLEFNLLGVGINNTEFVDIKNSKKESLVSLASDISGIEHTAGVVKGGTFILLCDENDLVVADFSLVGRLPCCRNPKPQEPPVKLASIYGQFMNERGGALTDAQVILKQTNNFKDRLVTTDEKGRYSFTNLQAGSYIVQASIGKVFSDTVTINLVAGDNKRVDLILQKEVILEGIIRGQVLAENPVGSKNIVVPSTKVVLTSLNNEQQLSVISGENGEFEFKNLNADIYTLQAYLEEAIESAEREVSTALIEVTLATGAIKSVDLIFKKTSVQAGNINILLFDSNTKKALSNAAVSIQHTEDRQATANLSTANNNNTRRPSYFFENIKTGKYIVKVNASGYKKESVATAVVTNKTAKLTIQLTKSIIIDRPIIVEPIIDRRRLVISRIPSTPLSRAPNLSAEEVYGERLGRYQTKFNAIPASVKRSVSAKSADKFIHETLVSEATDEAVFKQYQALVSQALKALGGSTTNKPHYKTIITTASLAFLDSLIMSNPKAPSGKAKAAIKEIKQVLNNADISSSEFEKQWDTNQLTKELKLGSIDSIVDTLR